MSRYASLYNQPVPQSEPLDERQVKNNAGGYVYALDKWSRLDRFLILGSDAPTYYQSAPKLTRENASVVQECYNEDARRTVIRIVEISKTGRAPRNDAAIFALALGTIHPDEKTRRLAYDAVDDVCRTGTHLFQFVSTARALGKGWGRGMKSTVGDWYDGRELDRLAYQVIKYRSREGYDHKRLLQTAHPVGDEDGPRGALYRWLVGKAVPMVELPVLVQAHLEAMEATSADQLIPLIKAHNLPWEALPTWALTDPKVWQAMLPSLGLTAIIRNLGNMTRIGTISPLSEGEAIAAKRITDGDEIRRSRVHPFTILQALTVYGRGHGERGGNTWAPSRRIMDALDKAFYKAFENVIPTGKRHLLALDVSGSMGSPLMGSPLTAREGSAAMALVTMATEEATHVVGFTADRTSSWGYGGSAVLRPLNISPQMRLGDVVNSIKDLPFGGTDCSLPILYASKNGIPVDAFVIYTDNETWAGNVHPAKALKDYRQQTGIDAKMIVVGMTSTGFSIADPKDPGMLDIVGFDSSAPAVMAQFLRG